MSEQESAPAPAPAPTPAAEPAPTFSLQAAGQTPAPEAQEVEGAIVTPINPPAEVGQPEATSARVYADKFNSDTELEKAYLELQKDYHARPKTAEMSMDALLQEAKLDGNEMAVNWSKDGKLTDEQYSKAVKLGWSRELVDTFMRGQAAHAQNTVYANQRLLERGFEMAGGREEFESLIRWANDKLPQERIEALDERFKDPRQFESVVKELLYDWQQETGRGKINQTILAGEAMPNMSSGFSSVDEYLAAMQDQKRQGRFDPAFLKRMKNTPKHIISGVDA